MTLRSWVCFETWFSLLRYDKTLTQQARLLDVADFFETRSPPVEASKYPKFISNKLTTFVEFGLQNGLNIGRFPGTGCPC